MAAGRIALFSLRSVKAQHGKERCTSGSGDDSLLGAWAFSDSADPRRLLARSRPTNRESEPGMMAGYRPGVYAPRPRSPPRAQHTPRLHDSQ